LSGFIKLKALNSHGYRIKTMPTIRIYSGCVLVVDPSWDGSKVRLAEEKGLTSPCLKAKRDVLLMRKVHRNPVSRDFVYSTETKPHKLNYGVNRLRA